MRLSVVVVVVVVDSIAYNLAAIFSIAVIRKVKVVKTGFFSHGFIRLLRMLTPIALALNQLSLGFFVHPDERAHLRFFLGLCSLFRIL